MGEGVKEQERKRKEVKNQKMEYIPLIKKKWGASRKEDSKRD